MRYFAIHSPLAPLLTRALNGTGSSGIFPCRTKCEHMWLTAHTHLLTVPKLHQSVSMSHLSPHGTCVFWQTYTTTAYAAGLGRGGGIVIDDFFGKNLCPTSRTSQSQKHSPLAPLVFPKTPSNQLSLPGLQGQVAALPVGHGLQFPKDPDRGGVGGCAGWSGWVLGWGVVHDYTLYPLVAHVPG